MTLDDLRTQPLPLARHAYWASRAYASVDAPMELSEHRKILWTPEDDAFLLAARAKNPKRYLGIVAKKTGRTPNACCHRVKQLMGKGK